MEENKKPRNPNAFPTPPETSYEFNEQGQKVGFQDGMTLRDYFAAKVMQSMINLLSPNDMNDSNYEWMSEISYKQADAMLKQREL